MKIRFWTICLVLLLAHVSSAHPPTACEHCSARWHDDGDLVFHSQERDRGVPRAIWVTPIEEARGVCAVTLPAQVARLAIITRGGYSPKKALYRFDSGEASWPGYAHCQEGLYFTVKDYEAFEDVNKQAAADRIKRMIDETRNLRFVPYGQSME